MWAVVVAEGLEIFWTLRKGEGCLGGMGPVTAAIEGMGWEGPVSMVEKVGDRAIEGRRGGVSGRGQMGGLVTYREEGRGGKGHEAQNALTGKPYSFFWRDRRQPTRSNPFRCASFYPFSSPRGFQPQQTPHQSTPLNWGHDTSQACGWSMHLRLDSPQSEKKK